MENKSNKDIFQILDDLIKKSDEIKRTYKPTPIFVSKKMYNWIKEHPKEFMDAYMRGISEFCKVSGLLD